MSAPTSIILQIIGWSIGMIIFSQLLSKKFGISATQQMDMQNKMQDMQEQMQLAQSNPQMMQELQIEMMAFMKEMMKKQLIPQFIRLFVFFGFIGLLRLLYADYSSGILPFSVLIFGSGYFGLYILTSFAISIGMGLIRMLIKKLRPGAEKKQEQFQDSVRALQKTLIISQTPSNPYANPYARSSMMPQLSSNSNSINQDWKQKLSEPQENQTEEEPKSWKDKLE